MLNDRRRPDSLFEAFRRAAADEAFRKTAVLELIGDASGPALLTARTRCP
jgi:hypothetical protein